MNRTEKRTEEKVAQKAAQKAVDVRELAKKLPLEARVFQQVVPAANIADFIEGHHATQQALRMVTVQPIQFGKAEATKDHPASWVATHFLVVYQKQIITPQPEKSLITRPNVIVQSGSNNGKGSKRLRGPVL